MISFFAKHKRPLFIGTVSIFLLSIIFAAGNFLSGSSTGAVADIGGRKIMYKDFLARVNRVLDNLSENGMTINEVMRNGVKQETFREMIVEEILSIESENYGMQVSDFEIAVEIQNTPQFQRNGVFDQRLYYQTVWSQLHMTPPEYEAWRKKARLADKFKGFVFSSIKITPDELKSFYLSKNKGKIKDFDKEKANFRNQLGQDKFLQTMNYHLRNITNRIEVRNYLNEREKGI